MIDELKIDHMLMLGIILKLDETELDGLYVRRIGIGPNDIKPESQQH